MIPDGAGDEFANTYKEWHYFTGGIALGFIAGLCAALLWTLAYGVRTDE